MTIYFASSEDTDVQVYNAAVVATPAAMGPEYSRVAYYGDENTRVADLVRIPIYQGLDFHVQFRGMVINGRDSFSSYPIVIKDEVVNKEFMRMSSINGHTLIAQYLSGSTWVTLSGSLITGLSVPYTFTTRVKLHPTEGIFAWYVNGNLQGEFVGDTTVCGAASGTIATFNNWFFQGGGTLSVTYINEFIVSSGDEFPYGLRVKSARLIASGSLSEWSGSYGNVSESVHNMADGISTNAQFQTMTFQVEPLTGSLADSRIRGVFMGRYGRSALVGPQGMVFVANMGGTLYASPTQSLTSGYSGSQYMWDLNPEISGAFNTTTLSTTEFGVRSV